MKEEILLTELIYKKIMEEKVAELMSLKQNQGETINNITIEKEVLKALRDKLKQTKKDIRRSKNKLNNYKSDLRNINKNLKKENENVKILSTEFITEDESYIDLNCFYNEQPKKR